MEHEYEGDERRRNAEHICTKEESIDDLCDDMNNVKNDINTIKTDKVHTNDLLTNIQAQLVKLEKRLYVDNGVLSIQTLLKNGDYRMTNIENSIKMNLDTTNKKIEEVEDQPRKYAVYTVGIITLLGILCSLIYWIATHTTIS